MENRDRRLSALLGIAVAFFGVAMNCGRCVEGAFGVRAAILGRSEADVLRNPIGDYEALAQLDPNFLDSRSFERDAALWLESVKPDFPISRWVGVLWSVSTDREKVVATRSGDGAEEGPAYHFSIDSTGAISPTSRWMRQRPWKIDGLENPSEWIIVHAAEGCDMTERRAALAIAALRSSACSKGALTIMKDGRIVDGEKRRKNPVGSK